jgi:predicted MFS family arabinose efflux permease
VANLRTRKSIAKDVNRFQSSQLWTFAFGLVVAVNFVAFTSYQILVPILPLHIRSLGGSEATVGMVVSALTFVAVIVRPFAGWLIDNANRRVVLVCMIAAFAVVGLFYPFAGSITALLAIRIVHGVGWSGINPAVVTMASSLIPPSRRGEGLAYQSTSQSLAMAVGPAIGLFVVGLAGYTEAFVVSAIFAFIALGLSFGIRDNHYVAKSERRRFRLQDLVERSAVAPSVVVAIMTFIFGGLTAFVPIDAADRSLGNPATFFVTFAVALVIIRPIVGKMNDRQAKRGILLLPGLALIGAALLVLAFTATSWTLVAVSLLYAGGFGAAQPILRAMVMDRAPEHRWGAASATWATAYELGLAAGALLLGILASQVGIPNMFGLASFIIVGGLIFVLVQGLHRS